MNKPRTLQISELHKRYGDVVALDGMSLDVRPGEILGFVGSNGAGKSTTMRIVLGVVAADSGRVDFDASPVTFETRRRIGYMPEERGLYPRMRVGEQLGYLARLHDLDRSSAARTIERWTKRLGVAEYLATEVQKLSLGNQQRVQLAAALVHDPDVLVLDEPFSGLDPIAVDVMSEVLAEKAAEGVPIIFSSHQLELVERVCDRVGIVASGRLVAAGTVAELRGDNESLVVDAPNAPPGWADRLPGVARARPEDGRTVIDLMEPEDGFPVDDQALLRAALATGPVREFARRRPSLAELFREVVSNGSPAQRPTEGERR